MEQKPNYYSIIPANVRYDKRLTPNSKLLFAEITSLCNMNGKCFATDDYFCRLYGVSKRSIQDWLKQLEDYGYIKREIEYKEGSKEILHRYVSILPYPSEENFTTPSEENFVDNNTNKLDINNTLTESNNNKEKEISLVELISKTMLKEYATPINSILWSSAIYKVAHTEESQEAIRYYFENYKEFMAEKYAPKIRTSRDLEEKITKIIDWRKVKNKPDTTLSAIAEVMGFTINEL